MLAGTGPLNSPWKRTALGSEAHIPIGIKRAGVLCPGPSLLPLFTQVRGTGILRSSHGTRPLTLRCGDEPELPHPSHAVFQSPEVHEPSVLRSQEEHLLHLHPLARRRVP